MKRVRLFVVSSMLVMIASMNLVAQTVTDIDLAGLHSTFNSLQGNTRLVFIGDPTCPACIASVGDLKNSIFNVCDNPDLRGLIVWVHMSGYPSVRTDAVAQSASWTDPRVTFYWDSLWDISYGFGYQGGWAGCNWAWDISMIYTSAATWTGTYPPAPYHCMSKTGCCNVWNVVNQRNQLNGLGACYNNTGMSESLTSNGLSILQNPASDFIEIKLETNEAYKLQIINILGKPVIDVENKNRIDVSGLSRGIYFLRVNQGDKFYTTRFVKE